MLHDLRVACRALYRARAFAVTSILTLAFVAGANAVVFAIVYGVLVRPLPFHDPGRLVAVWPNQFQSQADLIFIRERGAMLSDVASIAPGWTMSMTGSGEPTKVTVARVSGNFFATLGAPPLLGRTFSEPEARPGAPGIIVLSHEFWGRRFAADPGIVGRTVVIDGEPLEVVGVMPRAFEVLGLKTDAYTPFLLDASAWYHRLSFSLFIGRLAPDQPPVGAAADYAALIAQLRRERRLPDAFGRDATLLDLRAAQVGDVSASLIAIGCAVGLILVIGAANVGTLQLTRAAGRLREFAISAALGASQGRILRQLLLENAVVAAVGALVGIGLARAALSTMLRLLPKDTPRIHEIVVDWKIIASVLAAAILLTLLAGIPPALAPFRRRGALLLRVGASSDAPSSKRFGGTFVATEIALALILTIAAGLMLQSVWWLNRVDAGFRPERVLTLHLQPSGPKYRNLSIADYYDGILGRLRAIDGVTAVGAIQHLPFSGYSWTVPVQVQGHDVAPGASPPSVGLRIVTPGYFAAIGQPILAGRDFERADAQRQNAAVVNQTLATRFFGSPGAALGRMMRSRGGRGQAPWLTIVGVVGDVRHTALTAEAGLELYTSVARDSINAMMLAVRTAEGRPALGTAVSAGIWSVDPDVPVSDVQPMVARIQASLGYPRLVLSLLGSFSVIGTLLAVVGVYGVVAYSVTQQRRQIGIRMALGAQRGRILLQVFREASTYALAGMLVGIPSALAISTVMRTLIYGVSATDGMTYVATAAAVLGVVLAAAAVPALRAARTDPSEVLRHS